MPSKQTPQPNPQPASARETPKLDNRQPKPKPAASPSQLHAGIGLTLAAFVGWLLPPPQVLWSARPGGAEGFDWAEASSRPCEMRQLRLSNAERQSAILSPSHEREALATFAACGVVVIEDAVPQKDVATFRDALAARLGPHLASRVRVRTALKRAMLGRGSLKALWEDGETEAGRVQDELIFADGGEVRERNAGRLDVQLPWRGAPFGAAAFVHSGFARPLLKALLGEAHKLHSVHAIHSLGGDEAEAQHWHRDTSLLFDGHTAAAALPPYALNVFVPLVPLEARNGPTEFALGTHRHARDGALFTASVNASFAVGAGSLIIADYRTMHRGSVNQAAEPRPIAMLVYGRRWWTDTENYAGANYGGFGPPRQADPQTEAGRRETLLAPLEHAADAMSWAGAASRRNLFFGLVNRWERSLHRELEAEHR